MGGADRDDGRMTRELLPPPGIRVLRVLERGPRTERVLVHVEGDEGAGPAELVRIIDSAAIDGMRRAISALDRLHVVGLGGLLDVVDDGGVPAVLVSYQRGRFISELLVTRASWRAGEAVSALLTLAEAVDRMHDAGVAHGAIGPGRVMFTGSGSVLVDFDLAELFTPGAPEVVREGVEAVVRDRDALRELAVEVLARVEGARAAAAQDLRAQLGEASSAHLTSVLKSGLAQLAAATPVGLHDPGEEFDAGRPTPQIDRTHLSDSTIRPGHAGARFWAGLHGDDLASRMLSAWEALRAAFMRMPSVRRRLVVGGGAAIGVAGILLAAIPPPHEEKSGRPADVPSAQASGEFDPDPEASSAAGSHDDPAAAVIALLLRREECFRELSVLCLDEVDQLGSAALASDRDALLDLREGREAAAPEVAAVRPRVVERLGDSALVEVGDETAPASLLVMRSEAGWRIRDWVVGG